MKVTVEQSKMAFYVRAWTWQAPFPLEQKCKKCRQTSTLIMLVGDDNKELVDQRMPEVKVWPHDASTWAIYLCTNCGAARALWNQG